MLGSHLKAAVLEDAQSRDVSFDEKTLSFSSFADFISSRDFASVLRRPGTDVLVVPADQLAVLEAVERGELPETVAKPRIRPDFWQAFVGFPVSGQLRFYDPVLNRVTTQIGGIAPPGVFPITPINPGIQLKWRRDFVDSFGPNSPLFALRDKLNDGSGFRVFAAALRDNADLTEQWNRVWFEHIRQFIAEWAESHRVATEIWLYLPELENDAQSLRRRLYALLDNVPTAELLDLKIPLRWVFRPKEPPNSGQ